MEEKKEQMRNLLLEVFETLEKEGYDPLSQITGYSSSGDPGYVPSFKDARNKIISIDRTLLIQIMLKEFLNK